jgi:hypothetical protein
MWKASDGTAHTLAVSDPRAAMSAEFVRSIESLSAADRALVVDAVSAFDDELPSLLERMEVREQTTPDKDAIPEQYLKGEFASGAEVVEYLASVEPEWRLDSYLVVDDLIAELEDD